MQRCPFCMQSVRQCGGIALMTPAQIEGTSERQPLVGECCVDCMGLIAMVLDGLRNGKIRALVERLQASGAINHK